MNRSRELTSCEPQLIQVNSVTIHGVGSALGELFVAVEVLQLLDQQRAEVWSEHRESIDVWADGSVVDPLGRLKKCKQLRPQEVLV